MTDAVEKFKTLLQKMSYYNAAESDYIRETAPRLQCQADLKQAALDVYAQGLNPKTIVQEGNHLVTDFDWMPDERVIISYPEKARVLATKSGYVYQVGELERITHSIVWSTTKTFKTMPEAVQYFALFYDKKESVK